MIYLRGFNLVFEKLIPYFRLDRDLQMIECYFKSNQNLMEIGPVVIVLQAQGPHKTKLKKNFNAIFIVTTIFKVYRTFLQLIIFY